MFFFSKLTKSASIFDCKKDFNRKLIVETQEMKNLEFLMRKIKLGSLKFKYNAYRCK